jgi:hypothetical protein
MRQKERNELKEMIREVVQEEFKATLFRTITVEKGPDGPGDPEKRIESQEWNLLDFVAQYLPQVEGRLLGNQADISKMQNQVNDMVQKLQAVGQTLMAMEGAARNIGLLSDRLHRAIETKPLKQIGDDCGSGDFGQRLDHADNHFGRG